MTYCVDRLSVRVCEPVRGCKCGSISELNVCCSSGGAGYCFRRFVKGLFVCTKVWTYTV